MKKELSDFIRKDIPQQFNESSFLSKHFNRLNALFKGQILPPYEIIIHPSSICNLQCIWCIGKNIDAINNSVMEQRLSDPDNMIKMLKGVLKYKKTIYDPTIGQKKEYAVERIQFSGLTGEPLVYKKAVLKAIEFLYENNIFIGMFTNGVLMEEDTWDTLCKCNYVLVSLDSGSKESYKKMKCPNGRIDTFDMVCENIQNLIRTREKHGSKLDVNIGFVINSYNYEEVYDVAKYMKSLGVHYFRIKTDISSINILQPNEIERAERIVQNTKLNLEDDSFKIVQLHMINNEDEKKRTYRSCYMNSIMSAIASDGNIYPCNYNAKTGRFNYGNAIDQDFGTIFEEKIKQDQEWDIPKSCPQVCDPYKNRSNRLINQLEEYYFNCDPAFIRQMLQVD